MYMMIAKAHYIPIQLLASNKLIVAKLKRKQQPVQSIHFKPNNGYCTNGYIIEK